MPRTLGEDMPQRPSPAALNHLAFERETLVVEPGDVWRH